MLSRPCPRCSGKGAEPNDSAKNCMGCQGSGIVEVNDEPLDYKPSTAEGLMKIDPPKPRPLKKNLEVCGECVCCRRWKAKAHFANEHHESALKNARYWAAHWQQKYETLAKAHSLDQPKKE